MAGLAERLLKSNWPGALTIVAPILDQRISSLIMASSSSLAVRVPANNCVLMLLNHCRYLVGLAPTCQERGAEKRTRNHSIRELEGYDALLDGGTVEKGVESTIVSVEDKPKILREGAIKSRELIAVHWANLTSLCPPIDLGKKMHKTKFSSLLDRFGDEAAESEIIEIKGMGLVKMLA